MKHLQVTADVHEAVNMLKRRYNVDKLHLAIEEFMKEHDSDLIKQAHSVVNMRLGLEDIPNENLQPKRRNSKG